MTFGFVGRGGHSAGLRGARFQAVIARSRSAEIGWNLWGMLPHLLPQDGQASSSSMRFRTIRARSAPIRP